MKRWIWLILALTLTACGSATSMNGYGGYGNSGGGGGGGGSNNAGPPWHVTYMVNAVHSGSPATDGTAYNDGDTVTVKPVGNLTWYPFPFIGWTTENPGYNGFGANGGILYNPTDNADNTFTIHANVTLWAAWSN